MIGIGDPVFAELSNERRYQQLIDRLRLPAVRLPVSRRRTGVDATRTVRSRQQQQDPVERHHGR